MGLMVDYHSNIICEVGQMARERKVYTAAPARALSTRRSTRERAAQRARSASRQKMVLNKHTDTHTHTHTYAHTQMRAGEWREREEWRVCGISEPPHIRAVRVRAARGPQWA